MRWLSLGGIAGAILFAGVVLVCASLRPGYSHCAQFISELGARGTPHAGILNLLGFIPTGLLVLGFGLSLTSVLPAGRTSVGVVVLSSLFGLGLFLAGIFRCAPGCPQDAPTLHDGASVAAFVSAIAGSALSVRIFRATPEWRSLWLYSALSSVAAACLLAALVASIESRSLTGLWQRLLVGTLLLWCAVVGIRAFRIAGSGDEVA